jgi:tetratricopeptide (TPR) repeat protein
MGGGSPLSRAALVVAALALLAGTPAVMTAAHVRTPWVLASATAMAAVVVGLGSVWRDRYQRQGQRRDEQAVEIQEGCLMISGRLPKVSQIRDPLQLGVHPAPTGDLALDREPSTVISKVPAYVPRDIDDQLRELLAQGGFVLLVGDATAGKSRTGYEAMTATLPGHTLIVPHDRDALPSALAKATETRQCVLWLNDLESYLGPGALTRNKITGLVSGDGQHRVILATLRAAEEIRYTSDIAGPEASRQAHRAAREVLEQARRLRLPRLFSPAEQRRAEARGWDPRIADAVAHADTYGIAEYLAAGPELLRDWEDAWTPNTDPAAPANPRGAALVAAAVDIRRAGWSNPIPTRILDQVHDHYLVSVGGDRLQPEPPASAWEWACRPRRATTALLQRGSDHRVQVFDYLVDVVQRRTLPSDHVPEPVVRAAVEFGDPAESDSLAATAYLQGRYALAEYAYRRAYLARAERSDQGADHPDTLASRNNLALALRALGRLKEAEAEHRAVRNALERVLGPEHPHTLTSRGDLARVLRTMGRLEEAEAEHRAVAEALERVLGPEHPDTLASRGDLARVLQAMGRLREAEAQHRAILDMRLRLLGPEHPSALASRGSRASVLHELGRFEEAETEHRTVLDVRIRLLGPEHPRTLTSRGDLARALHALGRLKEAEAEHRAVLDIRRRVLGAEHHRTLASRGILASVLQELGQFEEAEAEHRSVLVIRTRILGSEHPRTLTSRADLGRVLQALGRLDEAEAEHRAVLDIRRRVLGPEHPDTLSSWHSVASTLNDLGRHGEAAAEHSAVLHLRIRVLGARHPSTLASHVCLSEALGEHDECNSD